MNSKTRRVPDASEPGPPVVGSVVFGPAANDGDYREREPEQPAQEGTAGAVPEEDAPFADFGAILAAASQNTERPTEVKTFDFKGKKLRFEIYTDGRDDAELWSRLSAAMMEGYSTEAAAKLTGKPFTGRQAVVPVGTAIKKIVVRDPGYLGLVKLYTLVAKTPAWSMDEALIMGHELGQSFVDVCEWAARVNGVTESLLRQRDDLEKNAAGLDRSAS